MQRTAPHESILRALVEKLNQESDEERRRAVAALGALGDEAAVAPLRRACDASEAFTRNEIAKALGQIGGLEATRALAAMAPTSYGAGVALCGLGTPGLDALCATIASERKFMEVLDLTARGERWLELAPDAVSQVPVLHEVLRDRYSSWDAKRRERPHVLHRRALSKDPVAVQMLTIVRDFAVLDQLIKVQTQLRDAAETEDTSHGGTTYWQAYGDFITAVDAMGTAVEPPQSR